MAVKKYNGKDWRRFQNDDNMLKKYCDYKGNNLKEIEWPWVKLRLSPFIILGIYNSGEIFNFGTIEMPFRYGTINKSACRYSFQILRKIIKTVKFAKIYGHWKQLTFTTNLLNICRTTAMKFDQLQTSLFAYDFNLQKFV